MNERSIVRKEIIGLSTKIVSAKNKSLIGLKGKIIDETKNMLTIKQNNKILKIIKDQVTLTLHFPNKTIKIEGKDLVGRSENRIKK